MPVATTTQVAELRRQTEVLVTKGYPALGGVGEAEFRALVEPLAAGVPDEPFVLVVTCGLVSLEHMVAATTLAGRSGFTTMAAEDLARFHPIPEVVLPDSPVYLLAGVDPGGDMRSVTPDDALPAIFAAGRTPLTVDEGVSVVTQHPEWLGERNCFEMLGSRAGDRRVTGLWVSERRPRLGWCWAGNPHTWLGMASAARRVGY